MVFAAFKPSGIGTKDTYSTYRKASASPPYAKPARSRIVESLSESSLDKKYAELNNALRVLAEIFPNVRPEVFREMLSTFSPESRLQVITEQLLRHQHKWVKGRWRVGARGASGSILKEVFDVDHAADEAAPERELVPPDETFRTEGYRRATISALSSEFRSLRSSAIAGVLAEQNYSYTLSRPILAGLAAKSWRLSLSSLLSRWKRSGQATPEGHHMILWTKPTPESSAATPQLRSTGSGELDQELRRSVLEPLLQQARDAQERISAELAELLNEEEAEAAGATYECQVCFTDTTFERMATCSTGAHTVCFR